VPLFPVLGAVLAIHGTTQVFPATTGIRERYDLTHDILGRDHLRVSLSTAAHSSPAPH
jgi:hypothetical protein